MCLVLNGRCHSRSCYIHEIFSFESLPLFCSVVGIAAAVKALVFQCAKNKWPIAFSFPIWISAINCKLMLQCIHTLTAAQPKWINEWMKKLTAYKHKHIQYMKRDWTEEMWGITLQTKNDIIKCTNFSLCVFIDKKRKHLELWFWYFSQTELLNPQLYSKYITNKI